MLIFHIIHIFEEVLAGFHIIDEIFGIRYFLILNLILFIIPLAMIFYLIRNKTFAAYFSLLYAGIMIINGLAHIIATVVTGRYFGGYAGGISGTGMVITGFFLIIFIRRKILNDRISSVK